MCGIAGSVALAAAAEPPSIESLARMIRAVAHRGPDESGLYRDEHAGLAHARLAIVDVATGQQPMSNPAGTLWLAFNGEIFNFVELREELRALGFTFRTQSDSEVIIAAYECWGELAFERFNGQFAIALWDAANRRMVLARDRFGVRPLYLCVHRGRLWFASEVKAIFAADPTIPRSFDPVGMAETFTFWTTVAPQSVFAGIAEFEPGHVRCISPSGSQEWAFSDVAAAVRGPATFDGTLDEAADALRATLGEAVRLRTVRSDVPVGSYLSGGLDSSAIAALGRRETGGEFHTFSIRFEDAEYDETRFQRSAAGFIGSTHHDTVVSGGEIAAVFPDVVVHAERPLLRTAPAPMYLLSRLVREAGIKVVLTGEGADEILAGYDLFREGMVRRFWGRMPESRLRPRLLERLYPYLARSPISQQAMARAFFGRGIEGWAAPGFSHMIRWQSATAIQRLFTVEHRRESGGIDVVARLLASVPGDFGSWPFLAQDQYLEIRTLLHGYILSSQGDRMLMAHGVEGRFPFLDVNVVQLASAFPDSYKLQGLEEKRVLKRAVRGLVPPEVIGRTKQPYRAPDARVFLGPAAPEWVGDILSAQAIESAGLFDPALVERLWRRCRTSAADGPLSNADDMALVGILSTGLLHHHVIARPLRGEVVGPHPTVIDRVGRDDGIPVAAQPARGRTFA